MGLDKTVKFRDAPPPWPAVRQTLASRGCEFQVAMIDGELAFPDEEPPETWRELRVRGKHGMITVRREEGQLVFVIWGNADAGLHDEWNALAQAFADHAAM